MSGKKIKANNGSDSRGKRYEPPRLFKYGSIRQFTQSTSLGAKADPGTAPLNMMVNCIAVLSAVDEHRHLLHDEGQKLFRQAIARTVKKGDVVLDLGTGTGLHAFFAVQSGAKKVYAIDGQPIIEIAKQAAVANGVADRIEFIYGDSGKVVLPEKVDVIITNIGFINILMSMPGAVRNFLKPGGRIIPGSISLSFVPVEFENTYDEKIEFWSKKRFGFDFSAFRTYAAEHPQVSHADPENFISDPQLVQLFDLRETVSSFQWKIKYKANRRATLSGLLGWYEMNLYRKVVLSAKPPLKVSPKIWTQPFLPLVTPVSVHKGDVIEVEMGVFFNAGLEGPIWSWNISVGGKCFEQSSLNAMPLAKHLLKKLGPSIDRHR